MKMGAGMWLIGYLTGNHRCGAGCQPARRLLPGPRGGLPPRRSLPSCPTRSDLPVSVRARIDRRTQRVPRPVLLHLHQKEGKVVVLGGVLDPVFQLFCDADGHLIYWENGYLAEEGF